ncbi:hypothetical protein ABEB36_003924 [Hypothenemus hampei]|uniref:Uncharacterized protein n=1 Tax=Hypothenemus hampei TaxID=57062 RepID=A0ABD1E5T2_HYPHA
MSDENNNFSTSDESDGENEIDKQILFVKKLKENVILFNKSQTPQIKKEKEVALQAQVSKKISNMKGEVKKKFDLNRTGNKKINYKLWEKQLLAILEVERNPVFAKIPGAMSVGLNNSQDILVEPTSSKSHPPSPTVTFTVKKQKNTSFCTSLETSETKNLSTSQLQRLVLLEQLKLIRMQQQEIQDKTQYGNLNVEEDGNVYFKL